MTTSPNNLTVTTSGTTALDSAEERVRYFQSLADKARAEAQQAQADKAALEQLNAQKEAAQRVILDASAATAQQTLERVQQLEAQIQQEKAERLRAEALMQHPELTPYAKFIPASTDAAILQTAIEEMKAAREADLAAMRAANPSLGAPPQVIAGQQMIPSAAPARPAPSAGIPAGKNLAEHIEEMMLDATRRSKAEGDPKIFLDAQAEAIRLTNAAASSK
jgi:hypothetical protein